MRWFVFEDRGQLVMFGPGERPGTFSVWQALSKAKHWTQAVYSHKGPMLATDLWSDIMQRVVNGEGRFLHTQPTLDEARKWITQ